MKLSTSKSKKRIEDYGEVFTSSREVDSMLDLVKQETERIDSRFLEPACGTGNFLISILERKLNVVEKKYKKTQLEFEKYSIIAISSIYGIDLLPDNVEEARKLLFDIFELKYKRLYKDKCKPKCSETVKFLLRKNIIVGDALTLQTTDTPPKPIVFSEWSLVNCSSIKRRDFTFKELLNREEIKGLPLFSDLGEEVFLPRPEKDYPLTHFLKIYEHDNE